MKKSYVALALALLLGALPATALATALAYPPETFGEALLREDGFLQVTGIALTDGAWDEVLLDAEDALVYDLQTGFLAELDDIFEGDMVRVVYEPGRNPWAQAEVIYLNAGEPGSADFKVAVSDNLWHSAEGCSFVTPDGKYRVTLTPDTLLLDSGGSPLALADFQPGMQMFVWATSVTASFPGLVVPDKVVVLEDCEAMENGCA